VKYNDALSTAKVKNVTKSRTMGT